MRVLIAGGVFRLDEASLQQRQAAPEVVLSQALRSQGVEVTTVPLERLAALALSRRFDIVHVHHLSKAAVFAALSPFAAPLVYTAHGVAPPSRRREAVGDRVVMSRLRARVCLSAAERESVAIEYPKYASKLHVIPNGFHFPINGAQRRALHPEGEIRGLFVGQLIPIKQIDRLVDVLVTNPRFHIRVVTHNHSLSEQLLEQARDAGVTDRLVLVGQLAGDALYAEYRNAHVLLLPSRYEALPSVIFEALSQGLPVVASSVGGIPEQVGTAGVLTDPESAESFIAGVQTLVASYDHFALAAESRAPEIVHSYSIAAMSERHLELYRQVTENAS